jgi:2-(1,2-epoxy-1,2-dihydrophenyl)acetyl-CoA isomerase
MYDDIDYATEDGIATVTLDRPDAYNAFRDATISELNDALARAMGDDCVYIVVLTGRGDAFCAGADVTEMSDWRDRTEEEYATFLKSVQDVVRKLRETGKPTIAAVNGPAIGAGCDFALGCDVRFVAPDAVLREGFVRVGLIPGDGGAWLLPRLIGEAKAREYLLTGEDITAETAEDLGLARDVVDDPLSAAHELADDLLDLPALALRHTKELIAHDGDFDSHLRRATEFQWECLNDPEHEEAIRAFGEDRDPEFDRDYS